MLEKTLRVISTPPGFSVVFCRLLKRPDGDLVGCYRSMIAERTGRMALRVAPVKHLLYNGPGAAEFYIHGPGCQREGDAVDLPGLPAILDAVID
jgi:hypothetical protein